MGKTSGIAWTDGTVNFWIGCTKVSAGCKNCYAETFAIRTGRDVWGPKGERQIGKSAYTDPIKWNRIPFIECPDCGWRGDFKVNAEGTVETGECCRNYGKPASALVPARRRIFTNSLSDFFEDRPDLIEPRARAFDIIEATPGIDWLILTKRIEMAQWLTPRRWADGWPKNIWIGTSTEDQATADQRIPYLLALPAAVRWLSVEPQLGPINIGLLGTIPKEITEGAYQLVAERLNWVIVGGESGAKHRPFDVEWARSLRDECAEAKVAFFMKQLGGHPNKRHDMSDFPDDLRIREFPDTFRIHNP